MQNVRIWPLILKELNLKSRKTGAEEATMAANGLGNKRNEFYTIKVS